MYFYINSSSKGIPPRQTMSECVLSLLSGTFQLKQGSSHRLWHYQQPRNRGNHNTVWPPGGAETCHLTRKRHQENWLQMSSARQGKEHDAGWRLFPEGSSTVFPCEPPAQRLVLEQIPFGNRAALGCFEFIPGQESGFLNSPVLAGCRWAVGGLFAEHSEARGPQTHFCPCSRRLLFF